MKVINYYNLDGESYLFYNKKKPIYFDKTHKIKVVRAPEPTDVYWENLEIPKSTKRNRKILSAICTGLIILISAAFIVWISLR